MTVQLTQGHLPGDSGKTPQFCVAAEDKEDFLWKKAALSA